MSNAHILTTAIRSGVLSQIKLVFDSTEANSEGPLELTIPLTTHPCIACPTLKLKRPFTFSEVPFPSDPSRYPSSSEAWTALTSRLYDWFRSAGQRNNDEWRWAVNYFWICYVTSTPHFPAVMNAVINWDPAIVPLSGEFVSTRAMAMALDEYIPWDEDDIRAHQVAKLMEWTMLKEKWISDGVDVDEYRCRILAHDF